MTGHIPLKRRNAASGLNKDTSQVGEIVNGTFDHIESVGQSRPSLSYGENVVDSLAKLSSGRRVSSARDDAASLTIGARLNAEAKSLSAATTNASQANSMLQIADGAMATVNSMLMRMKNLAVQGASSSLSATERAFVFDNFKSLRSEINRIAADTEFNGTKLLAGTRKTDFANISSAVNLRPAQGFSDVNFAFDAPNVGNGDSFELAYDSATATFTLTNTTSGQRQEIGFAFNSAIAALTPLAVILQPRLPASSSEINFGLAADEIRAGTGFTDLQKRAYQAGLVAQESALAKLGLSTDDFYTRLTTTQREEIADLGTSAVFRVVSPHVPTPEEGTTRDLDFSEFGLTVTLNSDFDGTASVSTNNSFSTSQSDRKTTMTYQIGTGAGANEDRLSIKPGQVNINSLNPELSRIRSFATAQDAESAITHVSRAIDVLQSSRANIGTTQNRLEFTQQNMRKSMENTEVVRSTLVDLDVASEMTRYTSQRILQLSGISMLSQANQMPGSVMRLLL